MDSFTETSLYASCKSVSQSVSEWVFITYKWVLGLYLSNGCLNTGHIAQPALKTSLQDGMVCYDVNVCITPSSIELTLISAHWEWVNVVSVERLIRVRYTIQYNTILYIRDDELLVDLIDLSLNQTRTHNYNVSRVSNHTIPYRDSLTPSRTSFSLHRIV